ncbi:MAG: 30S ribosomal protein S10 [Candidatus Dojkabacteria bacterium]
MQAIRIKVRGFDAGQVDASVRKVIETALRTGAKVSGPVPLPTRVKKWTVLTSPNIDKRSQEAFERRTSIRLVDITDTTPKTIDALTYLELPAGIVADIQIINK